MDNKKTGTVSVSKKALMQLIWYTVKKCDGVTEVADVSNKKKLSDIILKKNEPEGICIRKTKKGIFVDIYIIVKFGADSKKIKKDISEKVKRMASETGIKIDKVNIEIKDVE